MDDHALDDDRDRVKRVKLRHFKGTDRPVTAREIGNPEQVEFTTGVARLAYYSPLQRVVDTAVKKEKKGRRGIQHLRPI